MTHDCLLHQKSEADLLHQRLGIEISLTMISYVFYMLEFSENKLLEKAKRDRIFKEEVD